VAPHVPVEELASRMDALRARAASVRADALRKGMGARAIAKLGDVDSAFEELGRDVERARGGDPDAAEKARRALLEIDATIGDVDAELAWPALDAEVRQEIAWAVGWLSSHGTDDERRVMKETIVAIDKARIARDPHEIERQLRVVRRLGSSAYFRNPDAWEEQLNSASSRISNSPNLRRASELVSEGKRALARGDKAALEAAVRELWKLLPADADERRLGYSSGVR
jgi:molecular chaperone DnaK